MPSPRFRVVVSGATLSLGLSTLPVVVGFPACGPNPPPPPVATPTTVPEATPAPEATPIPEVTVTTMPTPTGTIPEASGGQPGKVPSGETLPTTNPPLPGDPPPGDPGALPTWDEVLSSHPSGATNPPIPMLVVTPDGRCFKQWRSPMVRMPPLPSPVQACAPGDDCGTQIQCPPEAPGILEKYKLGEPLTPSKH